MTASGLFQLALYLVVLIGLAKPLGGFMARVYDGQPTLLDSRARSSSAILSAAACASLPSGGSGEPRPR